MRFKINADLDERIAIMGRNSDTEDIDQVAACFRKQHQRLLADSVEHYQARGTR